MWCNIAINRSNTAVKRRRTSGRQVLSSSHDEFFAKEFNQPHRSFKSRYFKTAPLCCKTQNKMWNPQDNPCLIEFFPFLIFISIYKFLWLIQFFAHILRNSGRFFCFRLKFCAGDRRITDWTTCARLTFDRCVHLNWQIKVWTQQNCSLEKYWLNLFEAIAFKTWFDPVTIHHAQIQQFMLRLLK